MSVGFLAVRAPRRLLVRTLVLIAVTAAQGLIGLVQFATGVPEALVVAHVLGAVLLTSAAASVALATRTRPPDAPTQGPLAGRAEKSDARSVTGVTVEPLDT